MNLKLLIKMPEKKLALMLGYECNNNCVFCYAADKKNIPPMTTNRAKEELRKGLERGCRFVDFNGGEPSIRKDILELIRYAKELGYKIISMTTNGRMFYYPEFAEKIVKAGLNSLVFSIHGHNAKLHDCLTRVNGSFNQAVEGIKNIKEITPKVYVCTNTTITKLNYKFLPQIAENNIAIGADACEFIFVHPRGNALKNFDDIVPTFREVATVIPETIGIAKISGINHFYMRYFPLCYMIGYKNYLSELDALDKLKEQHIGPEFQDLNVEQGRRLHGRVKGKQCSACQYGSNCEGIFKEIAERRGFDELVPV
jgi:MoaA/NifB/PqqE/SkfB family radical SAM enzyme